jgi:signal transduction histidine kinase
MVMAGDKSPGGTGKATELGPLVRKVGHMVRNKLGVLVNSTYYLRLRLGDTDEKVARHLSLMEREVAVASAVIVDLMDFAMVKEPARRPLDVNQLVSDVLSDLARPDTVEVVAELMPGLPLIEADTMQIARALDRLLVNAVEAMPAGGRLTVCTGLGGRGQTVWITVSDSGPGIPAEALDRLFDPLFTTKPQGFGLGLPIARGFVERHGGQLEVQSSSVEGTTCTVTLPIGH